MRHFVLAILAGSAMLAAPAANAGGCGPAGSAYVTSPGCLSAVPVVPFYPVPAAVECETRDLVNQGQFYSTEPLIIRRTCTVRCPPPVIEPVPAIPMCWR